MVQRRPTLPTTHNYDSPGESADDEDSPIPKAPQWTSSPVRQRHVLHHRHVGGTTKRTHEPSRREAIPRYKRKRKRYGFSRWIRTCLLAGIPAYLLLIFLFLKRLNERNAPLVTKPTAATLSWKVLQRSLLKNIEDRPQRDFLELEKLKNRQQRRDGSILERRSRTRPPNSRLSQPPPLVLGRSMETYYESEETLRPGLSRKAKPEEICGAEAKSVATPLNFQARDALQMPKARISRVLLTGVLSRPAFMLALALHQQCGVEVVIGIDSMYPNSLRHRLDLQEQIAILTKTIPKISKPIMLSYIGLDSKKHPKNVKTLESTQEIDLVKSFSPTHIVHFASHDDDAFLKNRDEPRMYKLRNGLVSMEQILESVAMAPLNDRPHVLYASASYSWERRMDELLANYYYKEHGVFSVGMRLPNAIYGPWGSQGSALNKIFSGNSTQSLDMEELDLLHTDDLVSALIGAMQFRDIEATIFDIESAGTSLTGQQLEGIVSQILNPVESVVLPTLGSSVGSSLERIQQAIGWSPKMSIFAGIARAVAWNRDRSHPFGGGSETGDSILERNNQATCDSNDIVCHAGRPFLPCSSECSIHTQCQPTIFDDLASVVRDVTEECDYILYTQNFDRETKSLDISSEYIDDADPVICNVAFINQQSRLVDAVISKVPDQELGKLGIDMDPTTSAPEALQSHKYEKLNGRLLYRGWILIWTDVPNELPVYEEFLLKLSPGKILHDNVKAAVYIDQRFSVSPTYNDILFLIQELHRKAWSSRVLKRKTRPKAKFLLPSEPERHAVVLMSELKLQDSSKSKPLDQGVRISAYEATRFMRYSNGEEPLGREPPDIKLQREFYDKLRASINPDHGRHPDEPVHKFELKHWVKTSWVVHDLSLEESRLFRCEWYQEHVLWESKLDQLSFAYVMEKSELDRELEHNEPDESVQKHLAEATAVKKVLSDTFEWHALKTEQNKLYVPYSEMKMLPYEMESGDDHAMNSFGENSPAQLFVRIMSDRVMKLARRAWTSKGRDTHPANLQDEL